MANRDGHTDGWAAFGKLSAVVILVCTVLGTLYVVMEPRPDVIALVTTKDYNPAPSTKFANDSSPQYTYEHRRAAFDGFIEIMIRNTGDAEAENVVIDLPHSGAASLPDRDRLEEFSRQIVVGNIRPQKSTLLRIWTSGEPASYHEDAYSITHKAGVGDVAFARSTFGLLEAVYVHTPGFILVILFVASAYALLFVLAALIAGVSGSRIKFGERESDDEGDSEHDATKSGES